MNTENKKYQLAICHYIYNNSMPDRNKDSEYVECRNCEEEYPKMENFWVAGLITCKYCLPVVATREAKLL